MGQFTSIFLLALSVAPYIPSSQAWTLVWRNGAADNATVETESKAQPCKAINHTQGLKFSWNAHGGPWCIDFWKDRKCTDRVGWACGQIPWGKDSSKNLLAFDVHLAPSASSTMTTATSTSTPTSTTSATSSPATATTGAQTTTSTSDAGGGSSLSGGAIAGIVIGVVAGVAIIAALGFFFVLRRRRQKKAMATGQERDRHPSSPPPPPPTSPPEDPSVEKPMDVAKEPEKDYRQVPGSRLVELAGDTTTVELSDNNRVVELESPADVKRPIEP